MKGRKEIGILTTTVFSSFLLLVYIFPFTLEAQAPKGATVDKIVAKVDDYIILKSEVEKSYLDVLSKGNYQGSNTKCQVLEGLILNKLMAAKAEIDSVIVTDDRVEIELDMRMQQIIAQMGGDETAIEKYYGKTIEEFKDEMREQVKEQLMVQQMQSTIAADITITPSEVKQFFKKIPTDSLPYFSTEVTIGQIVKKPGTNEKEKDKAEQFLYKIRDRVLKGEDFQEMAKLYSEGPSRQYGGNLGWVRRGQMVPEFEAVAMRLKPGEVSKPVETEFGIHLIECVDRRGNEYNARHILIMHKFKQEDFDDASDFLDSLRVMIISDSLKFENIAKEFSDDKASAGSGGYIMGSDGSVHVPTSELDAGLFFILDTMDVGSITRPMKYTMPDRKEAMRILYYKDKYKPHQANLHDDYQKIQLAAKNAKQNKIMNEWFNDAKDDVYIEVDDEYKHCKILQ